MSAASRSEYCRDIGNVADASAQEPLTHCHRVDERGPTRRTSAPRRGRRALTRSSRAVSGPSLAASGRAAGGERAVVTMTRGTSGTDSPNCPSTAFIALSRPRLRANSASSVTCDCPPPPSNTWSMYAAQKPPPPRIVSFAASFVLLPSYPNSVNPVRPGRPRAQPPSKTVQRGSLSAIPWFRRRG